MIDTRPKCEHGILYPLDKCIVCMKQEIDRLNSHIIAIGQKLYDIEKELNKEHLKNNQLQLDMLRWFKYVEFKNLEKEDLNEYYATRTLLNTLFNNSYE